MLAYKQGGGVSPSVLKQFNDGMLAANRTARGRELLNLWKLTAFEPIPDSLGKNKPAKGDEKSWETLSKKYAESTKATAKAVDDKDAKAVNTALGGINCMECHKAHKGK